MIQKARHVYLMFAVPQKKNEAGVNFRGDESAINFLEHETVINIKRRILLFYSFSSRLSRFQLEVLFKRFDWRSCSWPSFRTIKDLKSLSFCCRLFLMVLHRFIKMPFGVHSFHLVKQSSSILSHYKVSGLCRCMKRLPRFHIVSLSTCFAF